MDDYIKSIGDEKLVVDMLVGDLQRVIEYPKLGFAVEQDVPGDVYDAYERLLGAGFDSRLISTRASGRRAGRGIASAAARLASLDDRK